VRHLPPTGIGIGLPWVSRAGASFAEASRGRWLYSFIGATHNFRAARSHRARTQGVSTPAPAGRADPLVAAPSCLLPSRLSRSSPLLRSLVGFLGYKLPMHSSEVPANKVKRLACRTVFLLAAPGSAIMPSADCCYRRIHLDGDVGSMGGQARQRRLDELEQRLSGPLPPVARRPTPLLL
jgi:hypothetical protein